MWNKILTPKIKINSDPLIGYKKGVLLDIFSHHSLVTKNLFLILFINVQPTGPKKVFQSIKQWCEMTHASSHDIPVPYTVYFQAGNDSRGAGQGYKNWIWTLNF